ncbi:hypothetical protein MNVM_20100 [Mycobacterium novum]|uniref:Uncharacterized protein n=1 Tax=Mycobacterium novum TaxID=2492438 RepID=A0A7I7JNJ3_9MYCO|nr:hypothetical protein MNVM_20100 [Mycobacterium novum]
MVLRGDDLLVLPDPQQQRQQEDQAGRQQGHLGVDPQRDAHTGEPIGHRVSSADQTRKLPSRAVGGRFRVWSSVYLPVPYDPAVLAPLAEAVRDSGLWGPITSG